GHPPQERHDLLGRLRPPEGDQHHRVVGLGLTRSLLGEAPLQLGEGLALVCRLSGRHAACVRAGGLGPVLAWVCGVGGGVAHVVSPVVRSAVGALRSRATAVIRMVKTSTTAPQITAALRYPQWSATTTRVAPIRAGTAYSSRRSTSGT